MAGTTSIMGLVSGLDVSSIIDQLVAIQNRQVQQITARQATRTTQLSAWTGLQTTIYGLRSAALSLSSSTTWQALAAQSSDEDVLSATADGSEAAPGSYSFTVEALAQAHQIASQGFADTGTTHTGIGTLDITVGSTTYAVTIASGQDTLAGVRDAVNAAGIGVHAAIINTGSGTTPYRLLLTSEETGADHAIRVTGHLSGGTAPDFSTAVEEAVTGTWTGTSLPTSGGTYSGTANKTFAFTVTSGGTVGTDTVTLSWEDGQGASGTFELAPGYTPDTPVTVAEGVTVSFSAGSLVTGEEFGIDVTTATIQAARDARISLGSTPGGGEPLVVTRSSNVIDDLVPGITLTLRQVSSAPVEVKVTRDTEGVRSAIQTFVNSYNSLVQLVATQTEYDPESAIAGPLLGDTSLVSLQAGIRGLMTGIVPDLSGAWTSLSAIGITTQAGGTLSISSAQLSECLSDDFDALGTLFRRLGSATDPNIVYLSATDETVAAATGYDVVITRAATQASYVGGTINTPSAESPLLIDGTNDALAITVDGITSGTIRLSHQSYSSGAALAEEIQSSINADSQLGRTDVTVEWVTDSETQGHLEIRSNRYGSASSVRWQETDGAAYDTLGIMASGSAYGLDVAGTLGGEPATGTGRVLTGNDGNAHTAGLSVTVNLTPAELLAQGGAQGTVTVTRGLADLVARWAAGVTDTSGGLVTRRQQAIQKQIDQYDAEIERMNERVAAKREQLEATFTQLESVLSELQNESSFLSQALSSLSRG